MSQDLPVPLPEPDMEDVPAELWGQNIVHPALFSTAKVESYARACMAPLREENARLKTVMIAAAEEIHAHWDAHCDTEGYGPQNLQHRLEEGIPSEYGYTAGAFEEIRKRAESAEAELTHLKAQETALQERVRELEAKRDSLSRALSEHIKAADERIDALGAALSRLKPQEPVAWQERQRLSNGGAWTNRGDHYTARGIRRLRCVRCGAQAEHEWSVCADGNRPRPVCVGCDVAINELVLRFMGHPDVDGAIARYRAQGGAAGETT